MTYYEQQVHLLKKAYFPEEVICRQVISAKEFIDRHFDGSISLSEIAGAACFSRFHFLRLFKNLYGCTPHQYLTARRIEEAMQLLQKNVPVREVCFAVGFESIPSFKTLFKKHTRHTPAAFQKKQYRIQR